MDFIAARTCIALLVSCRLGFQAVAKWWPRNRLDLVRGEVVAIRLEVGTGSVSADQCVIQDITREPTMSGQVKTKIAARAMVGH